MKWNENSSRSKWVHGFQVSGVVPGIQQMKEQSTDCLESQYTPSEILHRCSNSLYCHIFLKTKLDGRVQSLKLMLQHSWPSHTRPAVWRWESWQSVNFLKPLFQPFCITQCIIMNVSRKDFSKWKTWQGKLASGQQWLFCNNRDIEHFQHGHLVMLKTPKSHHFTFWVACSKYSLL